MENTRTAAALFDFDGVVMDTEAQYSNFWNSKGEIYHPEIKFFGDKIKGQTLTQIFDKHFNGKIDIQKKITEELNNFEKNMLFSYVRGVVDFMKELKDNGIKIAIVTSSNNIKMLNVYKVHPELKELVDLIITAELFTHSKPNPECFLLAAATFSVKPEECVVFEDSFHGLEAARKAHMFVVGLATTNKREAILDKADYVIDNFQDFTYDKLKSIFK